MAQPPPISKLNNRHSTVYEIYIHPTNKSDNFSCWKRVQIFSPHPPRPPIRIPIPSGRLPPGNQAVHGCRGRRQRKVSDGCQTHTPYQSKINAIYQTAYYYRHIPIYSTFNYRLPHYLIKKACPSFVCRFYFVRHCEQNAVNRSTTPSPAIHSQKSHFLISSYPAAAADCLKGMNRKTYVNFLFQIKLHNHQS